MPFGAHETMEVHEILAGKINMINHFQLYISQVQDPQLRHMIERQTQQALSSYNQLLSYTHDYQRVSPQMMNAVMQTSPQEIHYGLRNPVPESPASDMVRFNDKQIAAAVLSFHKNSAKNHMVAATECADPNVWQMMVNGSVACANAAYEVFRYMNQHGYYQIPTMDNHTAKTFLHHYQPVPTAMPTAMQYTGANPQQWGTMQQAQWGTSQPLQQGFSANPNPYQM